jgi:hypothetical protein
MYNDHKVFKWNKDHNGFISQDNVYNEILFYTGTNIKKQWGNQIAIDHDKRIVMNSNHFIHHQDRGASYDRLYGIFTNLVNNYKCLYDPHSGKEISDEYYDDNTYFFLTNAFSFTNSGHDLSTMMDRVKSIEKLGYKHLILMKGYLKRNNYNLIKLLLPEGVIIHELDFDTIYRFKNGVITYPETYHIYKYLDQHSRLKDKIIELYGDICEDLKGKNVLLIKSHRNGEVMNPSTSLNCEELIVSLEDSGFVYINPETMNIYKIVISLLFANKIVFNDGSISYTHKMFFNKDCKCVFLSINGRGMACGDRELINRMKTVGYNPGTINNDYKSIVDGILNT